MMAETDLISRQAAIDAIENTEWYHQNASKEMAIGASDEHQAWYKAEDVYKALESVPSTEQMLSEIKSYQMQAEEYLEHIKYLEAKIERLNGVIEGLKFAVRCNGVSGGEGALMDDLISRQAAIDALGEKPLAWTEGEYELGLQNQWQSDVDALNDLPSVQPERMTTGGKRESEVK